MYKNRMDLFELALSLLKNKGYAVHVGYGMDGTHVINVPDRFRIIFTFTGDPKASTLQITGECLFISAIWDVPPWEIFEGWNEIIVTHIDSLCKWMEKLNHMDKKDLKEYHLYSSEPLSWITKIIGEIFAPLDTQRIDYFNYVLFGLVELQLLESKDKIGYISKGGVNKKVFIDKNNIDLKWLEEFRNFLYRVKGWHVESIEHAKGVVSRPPIIPMFLPIIPADEPILNPGQQFIYDKLRNGIEQTTVGPNGLTVEREYKFNSHSIFFCSIVIKINKDRHFSLAESIHGDAGTVAVPFKQYHHPSTLLSELQKTKIWKAV